MATLYGMVLTLTCDPGSPYLDDLSDEDDYSLKQHRREKKKNTQPSSCHQKPPLPPYDPDFVLLYLSMRKDYDC